MGPIVDLVADLGEGFGTYSMGDDAALLEVVSSANIACGFHAGDPDIMNATVAECVRRGVSIGAHPSFPDLRGFGRRAMDLTADEVRNDVLYQFGALAAFAAYHDAAVVHLAPHGRLGNLVATGRCGRRRSRQHGPHCPGPGWRTRRRRKSAPAARRHCGHRGPCLPGRRHPGAAQPAGRGHPRPLGHR